MTNQKQLFFMSTNPDEVLPVLGDADVRGASGHVDDHASDGGHGVGVVLEVRQHIHDGVTNLT